MSLQLVGNPSRQLSSSPVVYSARRMFGTSGLFSFHRVQWKNMTAYILFVLVCSDHFMDTSYDQLQIPVLEAAVRALQVTETRRLSRRC